MNIWKIKRDNIYYHEWYEFIGLYFFNKRREDDIDHDICDSQWFQDDDYSYFLYFSNKWSWEMI